MTTQVGEQLNPIPTCAGPGGPRDGGGRGSVWSWSGSHRAGRGCPGRPRWVCCWLKSGPCPSPPGARLCLVSPVTRHTVSAAGSLASAPAGTLQGRSIPGYCCELWEATLGLAQGFVGQGGGLVGSRAQWSLLDWPGHHHPAGHACLVRTGGGADTRALCDLRQVISPRA
jgi:hypothetical protein